FNKKNIVKQYHKCDYSWDHHIITKTIIAVNALVIAFPKHLVTDVQDGRLGMHAHKSRLGITCFHPYLNYIINCVRIESLFISKSSLKCLFLRLLSWSKRILYGIFANISLVITTKRPKFSVAFYDRIFFLKKHIDTMAQFL
ncbi:hypothetical protein ACJX0J_028986, partial [Zea mays]